MQRWALATGLLAGLFAAPVHADDAAQAATRPTETIHLLNGKDLSGLYPWLKNTKRDDPKQVFRMENGVLHISGEDNGYLATDRAYRDYHVIVEYKWGKKTDGRKYVRNAGVLLNGIGPDGGASGVWMSCIECQLAQGCVGDIICIRGKDEKGESIPVRVTSDVVLGPDKKPRWTEGGKPQNFPPRQLWWNKHDPDFQELLDTRGKNDVESPLGDWTRVECLCDGNRLTILVNGQVVNKAYDIYPPAGKILIQSEGFEYYVRRFDLQPLPGSTK